MMPMQNLETYDIKHRMMEHNIPEEEFSHEDKLIVATVSSLSNCLKLSSWKEVTVLSTAFQDVDL